jgi:hypothetical protein
LPQGQGRGVSDEQLRVGLVVVVFVTLVVLFVARSMN